MIGAVPVEPFRVHVPDDELADLRVRLDRTRYIPSQPAAGWNAGVPVEYMRELLEHWRTRFDWRAVEASINGLPNHRIEVDGVGIHCVHLRGREPDSLPILLLHGWPSSFVELLDLAETLAGDEADPFDVVVPSLPGFGFSDAPPPENWDAPEDGEALLGLMSALGYERFAVHTHDIGASVMRTVLLDHPDRIIGYHTTEPGIPGPFPRPDPEAMSLRSASAERTPKSGTPTRAATSPSSRPAPRRSRTGSTTRLPASPRGSWRSGGRGRSRPAAVARCTSSSLSTRCWRTSPCTGTRARSTPRTGRTTARTRGHVRPASRRTSRSARR
jgi:pimeloyl-ACP methyl ester carboxylesterase